MNLISLLFGFSGRINRVQYWLGCVIGGVGGAMLLFMLAIMTMPAGGFPKSPEGLAHFASSASVAFGLPLLLMSWIGTALQTKRFHDRGRSGLWTLAPMAPVFMIVSNVIGGVTSGAGVDQIAASISMWFMLLQLVNLFIFVDLGCMPGKVEPNKYGNAPGGGFSGGGPVSDAPIPSKRTAPLAQPNPGASSSLASAESAIERAIAAHNKQAQTPAPRPAMATAQPAPGLRPVAAGSFGRKTPR